MMTSKRLVESKNSKSCPETDRKNKSGKGNQFNPEFSQLSSKRQTLPCADESAAKTMNPQCLRDILLECLSHNFGTKFADVVGFCKNWITGDWREIRMNVQSRLVKISYLEPVLLFENFAAFEKEIAIEWKKNKMLKGFVYVWAHLFRTFNFKSINQVQQYYNGFRQLFTTLSYYIFKSSFRNLIEKGLDVTHKLYIQTSVTFATQLKQWQQIYQNKIIGFLVEKSISFSQNFDLKDIEANPRILNIHSGLQFFNQTHKTLKRLTSTTNVRQIIDLMILFRSNLLKQIQQSISLQQVNRNNYKHITVEKQDVLGCIIFTLVRYKIDNIGVFLNYLSFLIGKDVDQFLSWMKVDCFRADIQAAYWFVSHPLVIVSTPSITD